MLRLLKKRSKKIGLSPGTPIHLGEETSAEIKITVIDYDETHFQEKDIKSAGDCLLFKKESTIKWLNIVGIHQADIFKKFSTLLSLHPLVIEDIMNNDQRARKWWTMKTTYTWF